VEEAVADSQRRAPGWIRDLPTLGVGLGFRKDLKRSILAHRDAIDFLELTVEHYVQPSLEQRWELASLRRAFPLIPHALGLSVGSAQPLDDSYVRDVSAVIERVKPPWWSEHIAMTRLGELDIGHLAPVPFTQQAVAVICENIARVKQAIPLPFLMENIAYTHVFGGSELSEAEFLAAVVTQSDCGLLLDVMNLYANSHNHGYDAFAFLDAIPLERVVQVHVIGGHWHDDFLVDSHSSPAPGEVWEILRYVAERVPLKAIAVEWDVGFPPFEAILHEIETARAVLGSARQRVGGEVRRAIG
jgi:uncharacterized protein (UPF0276 family)